MDMELSPSYIEIRNIPRKFLFIDGILDRVLLPRYHNMQSFTEYDIKGWGRRFCFQFLLLRKNSTNIPRTCTCLNIMSMLSSKKKYTVCLDSVDSLQLL
jgi:hypothetical protein